MNSGVYKKACKLAISRPWNPAEQVELWRGQILGQTTRLYIERDGGYVGIKISFAGCVFLEQYSVAMLTPHGWELMAWASEEQYNAWALRAKTWVKKESGRRRNTEPALWVTVTEAA